MKPVWVIKDERFLLHLDKMPHMESSSRIKATFAVLENETLKGKYLTVPPRLATNDELAMVHTRNHIERIAKSSGKALTSFDLDTQATEKSYEVARLGVGAVFNLMDEIWTSKNGRGFAFIRPPGHHAEPDRAMGFCLFNNIALGARYLQQRYAVKKIMIVDIDAHHGNGTQAAFYDGNDILFFSMHQYPGYPGTGSLGEVGQGKGEGFTVNVPLEKGCGDQDVARIIYFLLKPITESFHPEIILVSCGFDMYINDRLCQMRVTPEGYALITFLLLEIAEQICSGRIAFVMEGGYSLRGIRDCSLRVMQLLCDIPSLNRHTIHKVIESGYSKISFLKKVFEIQKKYWNHLP